MGSYKDLIEFVDQSGEYCHLNSTYLSNLWTWDVFPFIFVFIFSQQCLYLLLYKVFTSFIMFIPKVFYCFWCCYKWNCFLNFLFTLFIVSLPKYNFFLYPTTSLNSFLISNSSFVESLEFSVFKVMGSVNKDNFTFSFPIWMPLGFFLLWWWWLY